VSQHVAALEEELGAQLLERSRNGATLTEAGKILRRHARQALADLKHAKEAIRRARGLETATLRVAASTIPGGYLVPPVLAQLCERSPGLAVVLRQGDSRETAERVAGREAEVGVVGSRFDDRGMTYAPVGGDEIRLTVPRGHPWGARGSVAPSELANEPFVGREAGSGTARTVAEALAAAGLPAGSLKVRAHMGSSEAVKAAVQTGLGVAFLSDAATRREVDRGDLALVEVAGLRIARPFYLVKRAGSQLSPAAEAFWAAMLETYG
jgi:DNA-binding transcriptional LysR family regulator